MCWMQVYTYHICIHITYIMVLCRYHNKCIYSLYIFAYYIYNYILYLLSQFMYWQTSYFYLMNNGTINMGRMVTFCLFWDRFSLFLTHPGTCCEVPVKLVPIVIPMPWGSECWDYRDELPCLAQNLCLYEHAMCVYRCTICMCICGTNKSTSNVFIILHLLFWFFP